MKIEQTALKLKSSIEKTLVELNVSVQPCQSQIGSGALPTRTLESYAVVIEGNANYSATRLAESFRRMSVPVIGRVSCLLYTSPSPRDRTRSRMPSSA